VNTAVYPVNLVVAGRRCLVVGGGEVAARKVEGLREAEADVHVVAPSVSEEIRAMGVTWDERPYERGEAAAYRLVIACTDDPEVNRAVFEDGEDAGVWVNSADDPAHCSFTLPSRLHHGNLLVTVSTGGESPAFAAWLRQRLDEELGPEYDTLLELLAEARRDARERGTVTRPADWQRALDSGMLELIREGRIAEAKERLQACLSSSSA